MARLDFTLPAVRRAWIRRLRQPLNEAEFNERAMELFAWQFARVLPFRRLCLAHGVAPKALTDWREIPAVPQQLFKLEKLSSAGIRRPRAVYETSGTTTGGPGRQFLLETDIYQAMSVEGARQAGLFAGDPELHFFVAGPSEAPHSSLSAMFEFWRRALGQKGRRFWVNQGRPEFGLLRARLIRAIGERRPVGLAGTAFSFVHLLDAWTALPPLRLPRGSWLLETGGFKGRSREIPKAHLYAGMSRLFGISASAIWNEYGMSELSSQAYARGTSGLHFAPQWTRVVVGDPASGREVRVGGRGLVRWIDLANTDSVMALQTLDLAERTPRGFRLIGRLSRTEPRGCSLGAEDMMLTTSGAS